MRQSEIEKILKSGEAVPGGTIFNDGSTKSTRAVQLSRVTEKIERETEYTVERIQCYRLPRSKLPKGLKGSPVLWQLATEINGSTARSVDQLGERVWGSSLNGWSESNVENGIYQLRHDWGLNVKSTGYYGTKIKPSDD
jgi:hypothetical protein